MATLPTNPSPSTRARNPHLWPDKAPLGRQNDPDHTKTPPKRIRQSSKPLLNRLEAAFLCEVLKFRFKLVFPQSMRFKLGNGIWYKPDFIATPIGFESQDTRLRAFEVKGEHAFRGGFENLKVAAYQYPFVVWTLAWKENGKWKEQTVLP